MECIYGMAGPTNELTVLWSTCVGCTPWTLGRRWYRTFERTPSSYTNEAPRRYYSPPVCHTLVWPPAFPTSTTMEGTDATPEEVAEFREIFNLVDLDGGGSIDLDELKDLMDLLGMNASKDEMEAMVNEIDSEGTGEISFHDFVKVMSKKVTPDYTSDQVIASFKKFANKKTPNGYITKEDLVQVLSSYEGKMPEEDARELVEKIDCDPKTGLINYVEYVNMMMADSGKQPTAASPEATNGRDRSNSQAQQQ